MQVQVTLAHLLSLLTKPLTSCSSIFQLVTHSVEYSNRSSFFRKFPGGLVVQTVGFHYHGPCSVPGQGTGSRQTMQCAHPSPERSSLFKIIIVTVYSFARAAIIEKSRLNNRNVSSHSPGGWKPEIKRGLSQSVKKRDPLPHLV